MASLNRATAWRLALRSLLVQVPQNFRTMQGPGYLFALWPWLQKGEYRVKRVKAVSGFMNGHPVFSSFALGAMLRRMHEGDIERNDTEFVQWKESLISPLGVVGDTLIWDGWKPIVFSLGTLIILLLTTVPWFVPETVTEDVVNVSATTWFAVAFTCLLLYNVPLFWLRIWALRRSFRLGAEVLESGFHPSLRILRRFFGRAGVIIAGGVFALGFLRGSYGQWEHGGQFLITFAIVLLGQQRQLNIVYSCLLGFLAAAILPVLF